MCNHNSLIFLVTVFFLTSIPSFGQKEIAKKISSNIYKENCSFYKSKDLEKKEKLALKYRKKLIKMGVLDFISNEKDVYILEGYDLETGETYVAIWNEKSSVSYKYDGNSFELSDELFVSEKLKFMLTDWKLSEVKKASKGERAIIGGLDMSIAHYILEKNGIIKNVRRDSFEQFDDTDWE